MKKKLFALLIINLVSLSNVFGQLNNEISEREIKLSGNYYWGEGIRDSIGKAKKDAIMDLQYKISVTLKSDSESKLEEKGTDISSSFSKNVRMSSTIKIKGLEFFQKSRSDGKTLVDAYISKENYRKMVEEIKNDVSDRVKLAEAKEKEKGVATAIQQYYNAYLYSFLSPEAIPYSSITYKQSYNNVRFFLETKIKSFLAEIEIDQDEISVDPSASELITVNLDVNYLKLKLDNVELGFDLPGNPIQLVDKGKAKLFLYSQPSSIKEDYQINLYIAFNGGEDLADLNKNHKIFDKRKITLDFTQLVQFDYKTTLMQDGSLKFEPIIKNMSVSSIKWIFGKDATSEDVKAVYRFPKQEYLPVTMVVNGLEKMKVLKILNEKGEEMQQPSFEINFKLKESNPIIDDLLKRKSFDTAISALSKYKATGDVTFSFKSKDFFDISQCYGIIIDRTSRKVVALISPGNEKRTDLITNDEIINFREKFKGKGIIWFQLN